MPTRGKIFAMLTILLGLAASALSAYVLVTYEFYSVEWVQNKKTQSATPGLFVGKYYDGKLGIFLGPKNGMDMFATICGFIGFGFGFIATCLAFNSFWKCVCKVKNTAVSSCMFMVATFFQAMTVLVLVGLACRPDYDGHCELLNNAWLSVAAACTWFLASCFNRHIIGGDNPNLPK